MLLLDTHIFLWWCADHPSLKPPIKTTIGNPETQIFVSVASAWEISIKVGLGRLKIPFSVEKALSINQFEPLGIHFAHTEEVSRLPQHHRDPFDRMLIAQARTEQMTLVTHDNQFKPYDLNILWA